jgi:hypothetical protein
MVDKYVRPSDVLIVGARITDDVVRTLRTIVEPHLEAAIRADERRLALAVMSPDAVPGPVRDAIEAQVHAEYDERIDAAIEWGRAHAEEISVLPLFRALGVMPPARGEGGQ